MRRRLYVTDMDGTLLDERAQLSTTTRAGIERLLDAGVPFTVATARSPRSIAHILDGLPPALPVVALHGAILSDLAARRHIRLRLIERDAAAEMLRIARGHGAPAFVSTHTGTHDHVSYDTSDNDGTRWYEQSLIDAFDERRRPLPDVTAALDEQVVCFTVIDREERVRRVADDIHRTLPGRHTVHVFENAYSPGWWWINAHTADAGKGQGVRDLVEHTGLHDHEIVAFGDTGSDLHLFEASHRRVAVANAEPAVREAAGETIGPHTEDSVIRYILRDAGLDD